MVKYLHKIVVVGIGPGNPDYMVPAALKIIKEAKTLLGGSRALAQFARTDGAYESVPQNTMTIKSDIQAVMEYIKNELECNDVVVMVSGDPGYYSLMDALRREFFADQLKVIPGISAIQFAFSRLAMPWHDAELVSMHGREPKPGALDYTPGKVVAFLTDGKNNSQTIPEMLMKANWPSNGKIAICSRLSYEDEEIVQTTLLGASQMEPRKQCILVVWDD